MPDWLGKTIGRVRVEKLLARGGMAEVYLGTHLTLERPVAIKLLHSYIEEEPSLLERFHREAKVVAGLRHPNIVQVFDFDTADGHPFIVMEYFRGPTLGVYLNHLHQRKKRLPSDQIARLLKGLTGALDYAHGQGVIHRDIKPGNILLHSKADEIPLDQPLADNVEAIVTDFGLVRVMNATTQTASGIISGTPAYMSPEQALGTQIDHRTDLYSLGVILYEMLAGHVPFEADSTVTVLHMHIHTPPPPIPGVSPAVQAMIERALAKDPKDRYRASGEMASDFNRAVGMTARVETIPEPRVRVVPVEEPSEVAVSRLPRPAMIEPSPKSAPTVPEPLPKPMPRTKLEPSPKPAPRTESELSAKPTRSWAWIAVGLVSLVLVSAIATWALGLIPGGQTPNPPEMLSPTANPGIPATSATPSIPDRTNMVPIPAGTYTVGTDPADDYHVAPQTIQLHSFWIDQYQTTNAEYQTYLAANPSAPIPVGWPAAPGEEKHPVRGVTWDQANAYCRWKNKRLPTEAEWEATGRGQDTTPRLWPWGNSGPEGKLSQQNTYEVGTLSFNVTSPWKVYDMVGNVWEWVADSYSDSNIPAGEEILRGGRFSNPQDLAYRLPVAPDNTKYIRYAGFRCAADQVK